MDSPIVTHVTRLTLADTELARRAFAMMAEVFEREPSPLSDAYVERLLSRPEFWVIVALDGEEVVGCLTAHTLEMTSAEVSEVFIYDLAVRADHQRRGVGGRLVQSLREQARRVGIETVFVPADNEDEHALSFYRAQGGVPSPVTFFVFEG